MQNDKFDNSEETLPHPVLRIRSKFERIVSLEWQCLARLRPNSFSLSLSLVYDGRFSRNRSNGHPPRIHARRYIPRKGVGVRARVRGLFGPKAPIDFARYNLVNVKVKHTQPGNYP